MEIISFSKTDTEQITEGITRYDLLMITIAYGIALVSSIMFSIQIADVVNNPIYLVLIATSVGTIVIFIFSMVYENVSFYDPYWSVQPIIISLYWLILGVGSTNLIRQGLVLLCVLLWGIRLTYNWIKGWNGLNHEDWRYVKYRQDYPKLFPLIAFAGLEFMPTLLVFIACIPLYPALVTSSAHINMIDLIALNIALIATAIEYISDEQMRSFRDSNDDLDEIMNKGLWAYSRHPNYFGEIMFWFGVFLFGFAADPSWWWTIIGPIAMVILFVFVSIPLMEKRQLLKRVKYREYQNTVSKLVLWKKDE